MQSYSDYWVPSARAEQFRKNFSGVTGYYVQVTFTTCISSTRKGMAKKYISNLCAVEQATQAMSVWLRQKWS